MRKNSVSYFLTNPWCWCWNESFIAVLTENNVYVSKVVQEDVNILGNFCKLKLEWMSVVLTFFILLSSDLTNYCHMPLLGRN